MLNLEANIVRIRTELGVRNGTETIVRIRTELGVRIEPNPTLGIGYRVHFFTAGSEKTASQQGLPYREGFGEAFSQLRWHFK